MNALKTLDITSLREDFPILQKKVHGKNLVYMDSSATSLTPTPVIESVKKYYEEHNANVHRGVHKLGEEATILYERAHAFIAKLINAQAEEIVFTSGTTASLNLLAYALTKDLKKGDEIILTEMEHHSNIVPWQELAKEKGLNISYIPVLEDGTLDLNAYESMLSDATKIVSLTQMSNVLGTINDVKTIGKKAHERGATIIIDGAQSVPHIPVDVKDLNCDFLCFSGHKMLGPTGIGVLYGKKERLENLKPFLYGGDMISSVSFKESTWNELPYKFEAGTPNIAGAIGLGKAAEYLLNIGMENIKSHVDELCSYALKELLSVDGLKIHGSSESKDRGAVISFSLGDLHSHDISSLLDREGIAVRGGHLCAMPLVREVLKVNDVSRVSLHFYNTKGEIDLLVQSLKKIVGVFKE